MQTTNVPNWISQLSQRQYALFIGALIGGTAGLIGLIAAIAGPVIAVGGVIGALGGLFVLTNLNAALYALIAIMMLLPFGTLPFKIGLTPTLLDSIIGAFVLVYLLQWMTGRRRDFRITPVQMLIGIYMLWLILSFALGMRHAPATSTKLRQFAETLLSISLVFVLVDVLRNPQLLRRLAMMLMLAVGLQALLALFLYVIPDTMTESLLVRLARIGYPNGGVVRYLEDNPAMAERAIGTWVDPNALGGVMAIFLTIVSAQIAAPKPVIRRWVLVIIFGLLAAVLFLTFSRASILAAGVGIFVIGFVRYRQYLPLLAVGGALFLVLPQTQSYVNHFINAFTGADRSTQMRIGEYTDSFRLISRYPVFGVGFTGTPDIDLYTDAASTYLIMANQIGLVGLGLFLLTMTGVLLYGLHAWRLVKDNELLAPIHLAFHAGLITLMVNALVDLYFFRLDFQASITLLWVLVALALACSRVGMESSVVKQEAVM